MVAGEMTEAAIRSDPQAARRILGDREDECVRQLGEMREPAVAQTGQTVTV